MKDPLWGPIDRTQWRAVPHMDGALASESDVKAGRAVFFLDNLDEVPARPSSTPLPTLALWPDPEVGVRRPVVVIQIELGQKELVGIRFLEGGNGVCLLQELEMIDEDDHRWVGRCAPSRTPR
jgi:hypothetical protein